MQPKESHQTVGTYFSVVWKHKWLVVAFAGLVMAGAAIFTQRQPRIYQATAKIVIDPSAPQYLPSGNSREVVSLGTGNFWNTQAYFETQYRIIRSRKTAAVVVDRLGLARDLDFLGVSAIKDPEKRARALEKADPVSMLAGRVYVEPVEDSHVVLIRVKDRDPKRAADLANALAKAYEDSNLDRKISETGTAVQWLRGQARTVKDEMDGAEDALLEFKRARGIISASLGDQQNLVGLDIQDARRQLRDGRGEAARLQSMIEQIARLTPEQAATSVDAVLDNGLIQRLKEQLVSLENQRTSLLSRYLEAHPDVKAADEKIARVKAAIAREVAGVRKSLERSLRVARGTEAKLAADVERVQKQAKALAADELAYKRLEATVVSKKEVHTQLLMRLKEAELEGQARANNVRMLDAALVPGAPISPRAFMNLAVAAVLALLGGIGLALLVDGLDATVKNQDQLELEMGLTFLGIVPSLKSIKGKGRKRFERMDATTAYRYVMEHPNSTMAECVRTIRTNLLFMAPERELRKILVTSAGPREGKTSTCVNIGATMALSGSRILLVDSDLRRPKLHKVFGTSNSRGLTSMIMDSTVEVADVVHTSRVEGMDVLCSGPIPPNPAELLHTQAFMSTIDKLLASYDRVIFDSPPVVAVTDAQLLGTLCDGAVLVVRAGDTRRDLVRKAVRLLTDVNVNILGALLNNLDVRRRAYGQYYYQYYRQHGAYYSETGEEPSEA